MNWYKYGIIQLKVLTSLCLAKQDFNVAAVQFKHVLGKLEFALKNKNVLIPSTQSLFTHTQRSSHIFKTYYFQL